MPGTHLPLSPPRLVMRLVSRSLGLVMVVCGQAAVAKFNMEVTSAAIRPGGLVSGPALSEKSFANRVVLLEFCGLNCSLGIRSMPMLEELHKTLGPWV